MPTALAVDSTDVYFTSGYLTSGNVGAVSKVPKGGGQVTVLVAGLDQPYGIAVDSTDVYWVDGTGVHKVGLDGGAVTTLASGSNGGSIAIDATDVYWVAGSWAQGDNTILNKTPKSGGTTITLEVEPSPISSIAVDSTEVYWIEESGTVNQASVTGGAVTTLASSSSAYDIAIDGSNVYFTISNYPGALEKVPIGGGTVTVLASGLTYPGALVVDSTNLYWVDETTLKTMSLNGGAITVLASNLYYPSDVTVDAANVYWTDDAVREMTK